MTCRPSFRRGVTGSRREDMMMNTILGTLSALNGAMGLGLVGLFLFADDNPLIVLAIGAGLIVQAGYTIAFMNGRLDGFGNWSLRLLIVGQTAALVVGFLGSVSSARYNLSPTNGDYEYGPLAVGALIASQAAVALWIFAVRPSLAPGATGALNDRS